MELDLSEFTTYISTIDPYLQDKDILMYLFQRMDIDGSKKISIAELKSSLWGVSSIKKTETMFMQDFIEELQILLRRKNSEF